MGLTLPGRGKLRLLGIIRWRSLGSTESGCGANRKRWVVIIIENRHKTGPAAGHLLNAPMGCHRGWQSILKGRIHVSLEFASKRPVGTLEVQKNVRYRQIGRNEGNEDKGEEMGSSRSLLATLGDTTNAPAALERCLSSASCNKLTTLDPQSAPCLSASPETG